MYTLDNDVLIVGAGPSGLVTACFLAREGINFRIIEKRTKIKEATGALVIHPASLEVFAQLNISYKIIETSTIVNTISVKWNGSKIINIPLNPINKSLSKFPIILLEQYKLESILEDYLKEYGIQVERGVELISLEPSKDYITTWIVNQNNLLSVPRFKFLIGADGVNSKTRDLLKIPIKASKSKKAIFIIDFEGSCDTMPSNISFTFSRKQTLGLFPLKNSIIRLDGKLPDTIAIKDKITFDDIKHILPKSVKITNIKWFSISHVHHLIAYTFMRKNCFLVGDAAHTHNPVGGQGMNSGIQDAVNLAWKLVFVLKNNQSNSLLNTYTRERKPKVHVIMKVSRILYDFITFKSYFHKFLWLSTGRINSILLKKLLNNQRFNKYFNKIISQLWINYNSELVINGKNLQGPKPGERFRFDFMPDNLARKFTYKLIIFSRKDKLPEIDFPKNLPATLMIMQEKPENEHIFFELDIKTSRTYLLRPDNFVAIAVEGVKIELVLEYFNSLINEPVSV